jgi:flagellar assembly factor FliW
VGDRSIVANLTRVLLVLIEMSMITQTETSAPAIGIDGGLGGADDAVIDFVTGIPAFPDAKRFALEPLSASLEPFCRMRCLDQPSLSFTVFPPGTVFRDYSVTVDEEAVERLGLQTVDEIVVLAIVTLSVPPAPPTANLLGPIVINKSKRVAAQVVQYGSTYGAAVPLS